MKNVDGQPKQRKGSTRFTRRQNSRSNRSSIASLEEQDTGRTEAEYSRTGAGYR